MDTIKSNLPDPDGRASERSPRPHRDHWSRHARHWSAVGPPLRPGPEDVAHFSVLIDEVRQQLDGRPSQCLLLGVTPELADLFRANPGIRLLALDMNPDMLAQVLPASRQDCATEAGCGNWLRMPVRSDCMDCIIGDGCMTVLAGCNALEAFAVELRRVLKPGGGLVLRSFIRPEQTESVSEVMDDLGAGRIGSFHVFKWRLAMALHGDLNDGVAVDAIWQQWRALGLSAETLAAEQQWPLSSIETIQAYRDAPARYSFPTLAEVRGILGQYLEEKACLTGHYELAERCPVMLFERT